MALKDLTEEDYKNIIYMFNTEPTPAWQSLRTYITIALDEGRLDAQVKPQIAKIFNEYKKHVNNMMQEHKDKKEFNMYERWKQRLYALEDIEHLFKKANLSV